VSTLELLRRVRGVAHVASPRYWKWRRFLAELSLDPDQLPRPLTPPGDRDFIICGCPRSGTTLLSALLHQPPVAITVMEPWDGMRVPPSVLFRSLRQEIAQTGRLARGKLDIEALSADGEVRWRKEGITPAPVQVEEGYLLGVKWPAFWRYLDLLPRTRFLVCLRDPVEVIASFKKVGGRLSEGLEYDTVFNGPMNAELMRTRSPSLRRVHLFDYIHSRILPHLSRPEVLPVRYERWFSEPQQLLKEVGAFLGADFADTTEMIRPPVRPGLGESELDLIKNNCQTAAPLGYAL
jgi:Sulfotransferase family